MDLPTSGDRIAGAHVAVIGCGPAGLFAAECLAERGHLVTMFDRMPSVGRKLLMAGRGGLNLTHSETLNDFLERYPEADTAATLIRDAVRSFPPEALRAWADGLGQDTFIGSSGRVFPKRMKASPLLRAWLQRLDQRGVRIRLRHTWTGIVDPIQPSQARTSALTLQFRDGQDAVVLVDCNAVVLAMGGASWPRLGSNGDWVGQLGGRGVAITPLSPANCGVHVAWSDTFKSRFEGSPLKRISVRVGPQGTSEAPDECTPVRTATRGDLVITQSGLEGGPLYALGPALRAALTSNPTTTMFVDLKPDMTIAALRTRLARPRGAQSLSNHLRKSARLDANAIAVLREGFSDIHATAHDPDGMAQRIKAVPITATGLAGLERAISTAGGVSAVALTDGWMLRQHPGVFVAGEMVDWEAPTGGYLLQGCFASAHAAALAADGWLQHATWQPKACDT